MSSIKKILLTLVVISAVIIIPLYVIFTTFNNDDYRRAIIWSAHHFTDYELEINGAFSIDISMEPVIRAKQINIRALDKSIEVYIETIDLQIALKPLLSDTLNIKYLNISDVDINSFELEEESSQTDYSKSFTLLPILEIAEFRNIQYTYERSDTQIPVDIFLEKLQLKEVYPDGSRILEGAGRIGIDEFVLNGETGSLVELFEPTQPFPFMLNWELPGGTIRVEGTIGNPWTGQEVNLALSSNIHDVDYLLNRFYPDVPDLGHLNISGKLTGDYPTFTLESIQLSLLRDETVSINVAGRIEDFTTLAGLDLQYEITLNDSAIINRYLPEGSPHIQQLITNGRIQSNENEILIKEAKLQLANNEGLVIHVEGYTDLLDSLIGLPLDNTQITATITSPKTYALSPLLIEKIPELGSVAGQVILNIKDKIAVLGIKDFHTVNDGPLSVKVDGNLVFTKIFTDESTNEFSLDFYTTAQSTALISKLIKYEIPDIGPIDARFRLHGNNDQFTLENIKLLAGDSDTVKIKLEGHIDKFQSVKEFGSTDMQVSIHANNLASLSSYTKITLPEAGPVQSNFTIRGNSKALAIPEISLLVGDENNFRISAKGEIRQISLSPELEVAGVNIPLELHAQSSKQIFGLIDEALPELGPLYIKAVLIDHESNPRLQNIVLQVGDRQQAILQASGQLDYFLDTNIINLESLFETDISLLLSRITEQEVPDLGKITGKMKLDNSDGTLGFEILEVSGSKVGVYTLNARGVYDDIKHHRELEFDMQFHTEDLDHFDGLFGQDFPLTGPIGFKGHLSGSDEKASFAGDIDFMEGVFTVDLDVFLTGERPNITGKIFTPEIRMEKFINFYGQQTEESIKIKDEINPSDKTITKPSTNVFEQRKQVSEKQKTETTPLTPLFNKEPIDFDPLKLLDLDLQIIIDEVTGAESRIDKIDTRIKLDDGELRIHPANVYFEGGSVKVDANVVAGKPAHMSFKLEAEDVDLEQLTSRFQEEKTLDGDLHLNIDLTSTGNSLYEIVSNLNGKTGWVIENGKIYTNALDILHLDALRWFLGGVLKNQEREITCAISHYTIEDGLMTSDIFYFGTTTDEFRAEGTIHLPDEELDLVLQARQKKLLRRGRKSYEIGGTIRQPQVKGIPFIKAVFGIGKIFFAPVILLPGAAVGELWSKVDEGKGGTCVEHKEASEKRRKVSPD